MSVLGETDLVDAALETKGVDVVDRMFRSGHDRYCDYRPWIDANGVVWCLSCGSTVDSLTDASEYECWKCGCFKTNHDLDTRRCLQCGREC